MLPPRPGRRRTPLSPFTLLLGLLFLFTSTASAASAVLGIDLGTEFIKAALVKPGIPLEIVLTKDSKRKETSAVAFKSSTSGSASEEFPQRLYGSDALALAARYPGDVYPNLKPLLGLSVDGAGQDVMKDYQRRLPAVELVSLPGRGTAGFKSKSKTFAESEPLFSVEELLAMELKNVRHNAEALAGKGNVITDAVITVPTFYTVDERRAIELAAELAGLNVMALMSDGLAVGLNYATSRTFPSITEGGKPEYHMVFDMGAGSTSATVLRFQGRAVKDVGRYNKTIQEVSVLGSGWDRTLGGDAFNEVIVEDMFKKFVETPSAKKLGVSETNVRAHGRAAARLWNEAEKKRQVLSANLDARASFESLYDDVDFTYKLSRTEFEGLASTFVDRVDGPIAQALETAKLTFTDLESVILHGGAVRTPFVQKRLEALAGGSAKLRSNVN
ncbi:lumenal Hsp70 protein, partial [Cryomyces antarcticus]